MDFSIFSYENFHTKSLFFISLLSLPVREYITPRFDTTFHTEFYGRRGRPSSPNHHRVRKFTKQTRLPSPTTFAPKKKPETFSANDTNNHFGREPPFCQIIRGDVTHGAGGGKLVSMMRGDAGRRRPTAEIPEKGGRLISENSYHGTPTFIQSG